MEQVGERRSQHFYLILLLSIFILIGRESLNPKFIILISLFTWILIFLLDKKVYKNRFIVLRMFVLGIPLSFTNISGSSYAESNLSWYNIFFLLIVFIYLFGYVFKGKAYFNKISLISILILIILVVPLLLGENLIDGLKQYINTLVLYLLLIIGNSLKYDLNEKEKEQLVKDYLNSVLIASIGTLMQIISVRMFNIVIGKYQLLGGYRHSFGFLFEDYSFLSLYLVSGAVLLYFTTMHKGKLYKKEIFKIVIMLLASVLTSARTGIVAFIAVFALYSILKVLDLLRKGSVKSFLLIAINLVVAITAYLLVARTRGTAKLSSSGRGSLNSIAFNKFLKNPIFGVGLGNGNYGSMLPHNLLFQSLAQGGLLYTIPLFILLGIILYKSYKDNKELFPTILCVIFGAMFIPNIFNSRFFSAIIFILSLYL